MKRAVRESEEEAKDDVVYMLRVWIGEDKDVHASLKNLRSKKVTYFGTMTTLVKFVEQMEIDLRV